jgi:hypothetical protein
MTLLADPIKVRPLGGIGLRHHSTTEPVSAGYFKWFPAALTVGSSKTFRY